MENKIINIRENKILVSYIAEGAKGKSTYSEKCTFSSFKDLYKCLQWWRNDGYNIHSVKFIKI